MSRRGAPVVLGTPRDRELASLIAVAMPTLIGGQAEPDAALLMIHEQ
jgi:hypothetical protein